MSTPAMTFDERYRVIESRDTALRRAVRHGRALDRHLLPAELPRPHAQAGERHVLRDLARPRTRPGYRACKRCLPEAAPGSPEWNLRGDTAGRAMRLIADGVVEREGVPGLAARLGYSPRHLTRLLTTELGAGPLALSRAHRAHTARMLLVGTDLPAADVAFSAGFASVRQFNDTVREVFGMPPLELRARRRARRARRSSADAPGAIDLVLPHRGPLDAAGLFAWMRRARDRRRRGRHRRRRSPARCGSPADRPGSSSASTRSAACACGRASRTSATCSTLVTRARRLFDLDADPIAVDEALARHPELAPLVARGARHPRARRRRPARDAHPGDGRAADHGRGGAHRADARSPTRWGSASTGFDGAPLLFPTMAAIAERGHEVLRGPAARTRALIGAAARARRRHAAARRRATTAAEQRAALLAMPGIGPVDRRLRAHARDRRPRRVPARRRRRARRRRGSRHPVRGRARSTAWAARTAPWRSRT